MDHPVYISCLENAEDIVLLLAQYRPQAGVCVVRRVLALAGEELCIAPCHVVCVDLRPAIHVVEGSFSLAIVLYQELSIGRLC